MEYLGGGGLVQQIRKSYSLSDLTECDPHEERVGDEADDVLAEPRLIRRGPKSGPRRSASESNSRSPMYFPEVDVDVRGTRSSRSDEPDFSHIKSSEDISSGYSSADNSASLTRTASVGAAARARSRTTRTTVTTIKRPQAAEESQVIIEEPQDDDTFEYTNMPPLVNVPSPVFLSHSDPPFLYQCIGDQIKIIKVLGNLPLSVSPDRKTNENYQLDQKENNNAFDSLKNIEIAKEEPNNKEPKEIIIEESCVKTTSVEIDPNKSKELSSNSTENTYSIETNEPKDASENNNCKDDVNNPAIPIAKANEPTDINSIDTSCNDNDSAESDDEASFGTPDNSPKSKRKAAKGKYGKTKAPLPPPKSEQLEQDNNTLLNETSTTSRDSLTDIVNKLPDNAFKESDNRQSLIVNPIAEKKRRHKAKSPARTHKAASSGLGKLLQLPNKLAFWQKTDEQGKADITSTSSEDRSRRSSTIETPVDEFQSCSDLSNLTSEFDIGDNKNLQYVGVEKPVNVKDVAADVESETISHDIIEKSDALQKLIEAKLESHPEYKYVPLHDEIPTSSKSTDV